MNPTELKAAIDSIYTAIDGPPRAYFEIPIISRPPACQCDWPLFERFIYQTIRVSIVGEPEAVEHVLCGWAHTHLSNLIPKEQREDRAVLLFWRRHPSITEFIDERGRTCTCLSLRLVIPGYPLDDIASKDAEARWL